MVAAPGGKDKGANERVILVVASPEREVKKVSKCSRGWETLVAAPGGKDKGANERVILVVASPEREVKKVSK